MDNVDVKFPGVEETVSTATAGKSIIQFSRTGRILHSVNDQAVYLTKMGLDGGRTKSPMIEFKSKVLKT